MKGAFQKRKQGSYTIEAAVLVPLILYTLSAVMMIGFSSAGELVKEMRTIQVEWCARDVRDLPEIVRMGQASAGWFGEE